MPSSPKTPEIDHRSIKLLIGVFALALPLVTDIFSEHKIPSISASYYVEGWARNLFVGILLAITALLLPYNGNSFKQMWLSKGAAITAFGVAMFPCGREGVVEITTWVHYISAGIMFLILAGFCWIFHKRAIQKGHLEALRRSKVYLLCAAVILASMGAMALNLMQHKAISDNFSRYTFWCESAALIAFGFSWLIASKILPFMSDGNERLRFWR